MNTSFCFFSKAHCARVNVNQIQRTKDDYIENQISTIYSSTTFESLLMNVQQLRAKLLQLGCFREVVAIIDKAKGWRKEKRFHFCSLIDREFI